MMPKNTDPLQRAPRAVTLRDLCGIAKQSGGTPMSAVAPEPERRMRLALFMTGDGNYHMGGWRLPGSTCDGGQNIQRYVEACQSIERAKLDMLFIADGPGVGGTEDMESLSLISRIDRLEPLAILSALAMTTQRLGLVATLTTSYTEPFNVARAMASLDHISNGRAGWNIVTGGNKDDALNFNLDQHVPHAERYLRAEE